MKTKYLRYSWPIFFLGFLCFFVYTGCSNEADRTFSLNNKGEKPDPIKEYNVTPLKGGVLIDFKIPESDDLLYIKAVYETAPGIVRDNKTSVYNNSLRLEGYAKEGTHKVTLYTVAKDEVYSDPTTIDVEILAVTLLQTCGMIMLTVH